MPKERESKELVKLPPPGTLATRSAPVEGLEELDANDMAKPRLAIAQALSPQIDETSAKRIDGLRKGMFFSTTGVPLGTKVNFIVIFAYKSRIFFNPRETGGGIRCQAQDNRVGVGNPGGVCASCPYSQWQDGGKLPPACTFFYNYVGFVAPKSGSPSPDDFIICSLKATQLGPAKQWNSLMSMQARKVGARLEKVPAYYRLYSLETFEDKRPKGVFYNLRARVVGDTPAEFLSTAADCYQVVKQLHQQGRLKVDVADLTGAEADPDAAPAAESREPGDGGPF